MKDDVAHRPDALSSGRWPLRVVAAWLVLGLPSGAVAKAGMSILYWRNAKGLLPVVCFDAASAKWRNADACIQAPPSESIAATVPDGGKLILGGVKKLPFCSYFPDQTPAQRTYKAMSGTPSSSYVVWPEEALKDIHAVAAQPVAPSPQERSLLAQALAAEAKDPALDGPLEVDQSLQLDLDGDGKAERLYAVRKGYKDPSRQVMGFGALYLARGSAPGKLEAVRSERSFKTRYKLLATSDLDHDGRPEVWIESSHEAGEGSQGGAVLTWEKGKLSAVGTWLCEGET